MARGEHMQHTPPSPAASRHPLPSKARGGFTFIEVLATLTLLAIVLPTVMKGYSLSLATASYAKTQSQAAALGHSKLMELATDGSWQFGILSGDFGAEFPEYTWAAQVDGFDDTLDQLDLTVTWKQAGKPRTLTFSTLVKPADTSGGTSSGTSGGTSPR